MSSPEVPRSLPEMKGGGMEAGTLHGQEAKAGL